MEQKVDHGVEAGLMQGLNTRIQCRGLFDSIRAWGPLRGSGCRV